MRAANINVVKTYLPVGRAVLDKLLAHGMVAIVDGAEHAPATTSRRRSSTCATTPPC